MTLRTIRVALLSYEYFLKLRGAEPRVTDAKIIIAIVEIYSIKQVPGIHNASKLKGYLTIGMYIALVTSLRFLGNPHLQIESNKCEGQLHPTYLMI